MYNIYTGCLPPHDFPESRLRDCPSFQPPPLSPPFILPLLDEDGVHHGGEQHPHYSISGATGLYKNGIRRLATIHVKNVSGLDGYTKDGRQSRAKVTPTLIAEHSVFRVIAEQGQI